MVVRKCWHIRWLNLCYFKSTTLEEYWCRIVIIVCYWKTSGNNPRVHKPSQLCLAIRITETTNIYDNIGNVLIFTLPFCYPIMSIQKTLIKRYFVPRHAFYVCSRFDMTIIANSRNFAIHAHFCENIHSNIISICREFARLRIP